MLSLSAQIRKTFGRKIKTLRKKGILPAILYGPKIKEGQALELDEKNFEKVYQQAGESALISLEIDNKKLPVLIHEVQKDPLTEKPIHVDFYLPDLKEEIEVKVPLVFEGSSLAVKDLGGTLVKNIQELEIRAKPQDLPSEIKVNIEKLKNFEDKILIEDLVLPKGIKILRNPQEIVALVVPPEKMEEELIKPAEEKIVEAEKGEEETLEK